MKDRFLLFGNSHRISKCSAWASILACVLMAACSDESVSSVGADDDNSDPSALCGNGVLDEGEICDAEKLSRSASCPKGKYLPPDAYFTCNDDCTLNTDACVAEASSDPCGNEALDEGEICDGDIFNKAASCPEGTYLPSDASLLCREDCTLDTSSCIPVEKEDPCGNGALDEEEICDGSLIRKSASCPENTHLAEGQTLTCNEDCTLNTSACVQDELPPDPPGPAEPAQGIVKHDTLTEIPIHRTPQYHYPNDTLKNEHGDAEKPQIVGHINKGDTVELHGIVGEKSFLGGSYLIDFDDGQYYIHSNNIELINDSPVDTIDYSSASTPNYYQNDAKWKDVKYRTTNIGVHGGGPTALANAIAILKDNKDITPETIAKKMDLYQDITSGEGTERAVVCPMIEREYDLECEYFDTSKGMNYGTEESTKKNDANTREKTKQKIEEAFKNGWYIVALEGGAKSYWTSDTSRHYLTVYGYDKANDTLYVDDPVNVHYMQKGMEEFLNYTHSIFVITNKPADKKCTPKTCANYVGKCGDSLNDGCGGKLNCTCSDGKACVQSVCGINKDVYPKRKSIKGIQPDGSDAQIMIDSNVHGVVYNMVWALMQPSKKKAPCTKDKEVEYKGYCYNPTGTADYREKIKKYTDAGVVATAIVYGVPAWAQIKNDSICKNNKYVQSSWFCATEDGYADDFGRFAGFLAWYFNGIEHDGNKGGRIADFVIHNEVNCSHWYNIGCHDYNDKYKDCDREKWISRYAADWNKAYDYIRAEQKQAKVFMSFDHMFDWNIWQHTSVQYFIKSVVKKLGTREWRIAFHSYPPDLTEPQFSANDWPIISFGNIGILAGWLRQNYPDKPHAWEIHLTENGLNGRPEQENAQNTYLCKAFKNVLGTPGIESFIFHRYRDADEGGLKLGLVHKDGTAKPAWSTYVNANKPGAGKCGFELLPYVELARYLNSSTGNRWVTTRMPPDGFHHENSWKIYRDKPTFGDPIMLYECRFGDSKQHYQTKISTNVNCDGNFNMGPMGYAFKSKQKNTVALYQCKVGNTFFITDASNCENQIKDKLIGYVYRK